MKKRILSILMALAIAIGAMGSAVAVYSIQANADPSISVTLDGKELSLEDVNGKQVDPIYIDGTTYLPVRAISEALGMDVEWNTAKNQVELSTGAEEKATSLAFASVTSGDIMGYTMGGVSYFYGIPYAKADRFHMPEAADSWTNIKPCMMHGEVAPQNKTTMEMFDAFTYSEEMVENEDTMLNLNVMTANLNGTEKKPVVVWLHGGGMTTGGSMEKTFYDGGNLAAYGDVVFVSINHRLNALGFLDLSAYGEEYKYSGNVGMADIVFALEWVQDNIANFGGDPDNVTIVGQSGGGTKVTTLMGMPAARGLFHKAVAMSGGSAKVTRTTEQAQAETEKVLDILGITAENIKDIETIDYEVLYNACTEAGVNYGPVVDGDYYPTGTYEMSKDIPLMCGNVLGEFSTNFGNLIIPAMTANRNAVESALLPNITEADVLERLTQNYGGDADKAASVIAAFKEAYPGHEIGEVLYINNRAAGMSAMPLAEAMESYGGIVYQYIQAAPYPMFDGIVPIHTAGDVPLWFHNVEMIPGWVNGDEATFNRISDEMAGALAAFAWTGDPSANGLDWSEWTNDGDGIMVFDLDESTMRYHHEDNLFAAMNAENAG